jgi:hypothetical protein
MFLSYRKIYSTHQCLLHMCLCFSCWSNDVSQQAVAMHDILWKQGTSHWEEAKSWLSMDTYLALRDSCITMTAHVAWLPIWRQRAYCSRSSSGVVKSAVAMYNLCRHKEQSTKMQKEYRSLWTHTQSLGIRAVQQIHGNRVLTHWDRDTEPNNATLRHRYRVICTLQNT